MKKSLLTLLFFVAVGIRLAPGLHTIIFPYDQARDVLIVKRMVETRHPTLLGPVSDISGVHHGAIFYWLLVPLYAINNYDPALAVVFFAVFSSIGVFTYFYVIRRFFNETTAWIGAALYTFSFAIVSYSRWISNPVLIIPLMPLFAFALSEVLHKRKHAFVLGLLFGIFVQLELVLGYLLFIVGYSLLRGKNKVRMVLMGVLGFVLGAFPLIFAELKFHFQGIQGLLSSFSHSSGHTNIKASALLHNVPNFYGGIAKDTLFGVGIPLVGVCLFLFLFWLIKQRKHISSKERNSLQVLLLISCSSILLFLTGKPLVNFFFVGIEFCFIAVAAFALSLQQKQSSRVYAAILCILMFGAQIRLYVIQTRESRAYVQVQQGVLLSQRDEVIAAIYQHVGPQQFTLSVLGTPYGVRTAWGYYLWRYSQQHGTQMPTWYGFAANGYIGDELLPKVDAPGLVHVTIYEPFVDIDSNAVEEFTKYQTDKTILKQEFEVNHHRIQMRAPKPLGK